MAGLMNESESDRAAQLRAEIDALDVVQVDNEELEVLAKSARGLIERITKVITEKDKATPEEEVDLDARRTAGADHFKAKRYREAIAEWILVDRELKDRGNRDAKLLSNIAAAQLAIHKFVAASMFGAEATDVDPDWWKGHFYRGQALVALVKGKPPSKAMGDRLEQAIASLRACRKCSSLPQSKISEIENLIANANSLGLSMTSVCNQQ